MHKSVYDIIKKQNGERFASELRRYDNGIFDVPNLPEIVRYAGRQAKDLLPYLSSLKKIKIKKQKRVQNPFKLLKKAGYQAYEADTLEKQNAIKKYFAPGEELCTFNDPERYQTYYIVNAVKKGAEKLRRCDFQHPKREDAYGTSVLSIQILKTGGFISIKNRYNHTVLHPDNTFSSNPDNIIDGLSAALRDYFKTDFSSEASNLPEGYRLMGRQIIQYNEERDGIYFGASFYLKNGVMHPLNKDYEVMIDSCFILNLKDKTLIDPSGYDALAELVTSELKGRRLRFLPCPQGGYRLWADAYEIMRLNAARQITRLYLPDVTQIGNGVLNGCPALKEIVAPRLKKVGHGFACEAKLKKFHAPLLEAVGDEFLWASDLTQIDLPQLKYTGAYFLRSCSSLSSVCFPSLIEAGDYFLNKSYLLEHFSAPCLKTAGDAFLKYSCALSRLDLPCLERVGKEFCYRNEALKTLNVPALVCAGADFMYCNTVLKVFNAPKLPMSNRAYILVSHPNRIKRLGLTQKEGARLIFKGAFSKEKRLCARRYLERYR